MTGKARKRSVMECAKRSLVREDKRAALRDAQLATKAKYHHPYYWAAFQMTGAVE
ncbi:MAG: CHAT domain-containing protein [Gammaproteobacteria bacterium]|nr:MAG: CHAT domain-containing protein [Gammaproteobacteria bacterium]